MNSGLIDESVEVFKLIDDPVLIVLVIVIISLMIFIFKINRQAERREKKYFNMICTLTGEIQRSTNTLTKLAALLEVFIGSQNKTNNHN